MHIFTIYLKTIRRYLVQLPAIQNRRWFAAAWLVVTGIFIVVILLVIQINTSDKTKAVAAAENFMIALQSDDVDGAYDMTAPAFRKTVTEEQLRQAFDQIGPFVRRAQLEAVEVQYPVKYKPGSRAIFVYKATTQTKVSYMHLVMEKHSNQWLIHSLQTSETPLKARSR